jgi:broad specificity phosphatase PhoE
LTSCLSSKFIVYFIILTLNNILKYFDETPDIIYDDRLREKISGDFFNRTKEEKENKSKEITGITIKEIEDKFENDEIGKYFEYGNFFGKLNKYIEENDKNVETSKDLYERYKSFIDELKKHKYKKILIVCHSGTIT